MIIFIRQNYIKFSLKTTNDRASKLILTGFEILIRVFIIFSEGVLFNFFNRLPWYSGRTAPRNNRGPEAQVCQLGPSPPR